MDRSGLQDYSFAADIWSLGLCVYELACGAQLSDCTALQHPLERQKCLQGVYPYGSVASFPVLFDNLCHRPLVTPVLLMFGHPSHIAQARASPLRGPFLERATLPCAMSWAMGHGPWPASARHSSTQKECQALSLRRGSTVLPPRIVMTLVALNPIRFVPACTRLGRCKKPEKRWSAIELQDSLGQVGPSDPSIPLQGIRVYPRQLA